MGLKETGVTEFELKFEIPADRRRLVEAALRRGKVDRVHLRACYFDTEESRLARYGIALRLRHEGGGWVQTAKGPGIGPLLRQEHNFELETAIKKSVPTVDLARHSGTPVGMQIEKALKLRSGAAAPLMKPVYETDILRLKRTARHAGTVVEMALDRGRIFTVQLSQAVCELELELKRGTPENLVHMARKWCAGHGLWLNSISKSARGQMLGGDGRASVPTSATPPYIERHADGQQIARAVIQACLTQVLANASVVAGGSGSPEHIHQLRVGLRRLRTAIRELQTIAKGIDLSWEEPLKAVFRSLGQHRDQSHLGDVLAPEIEADGGPSLPALVAGSTAIDPCRITRSPAFQDVLLCLIGFAYGSAIDHDAVAYDKVQKLASRRLQSLRSTIAKEGKKFSALDEVRQHRLRKRLKKLRYFAEFVSPLFPPRRTKAFLSHLKPVQDALGDHNDILVGLRAYRALAVADSEAWFGVGWLSARRSCSTSMCQRQMDAFARLIPFWD